MIDGNLSNAPSSDSHRSLNLSGVLKVSSTEVILTLYGTSPKTHERTVTCRGRINKTDDQVTMVIPLLCSDKVMGSAALKLDQKDDPSGFGSLMRNDDSGGGLIFGKETQRNFVL
jgi:hypothetical protein